MNEASEQMARLIYALLLIGLVTGGITSVVGLVLAHIHARDADWPYRDHFRFQYRTFWIGLLYYVIAGITTLALIGWLLLVVIVAWWILRCVRGLTALARDEPPAQPETWGF